MDLTAALTEAPWRRLLAALVILAGGWQLWHGLIGGATSDRGMLRRRASFLERIEGFRLILLGVVLIGLGAAWWWESRLLLYLALGFGVVELRESSLIIGAVKRGSGRVSQR